MCIDEASDLFNVCVSVKVWKHKFLLNTALSRKQKHPNYKLFDSYFQVDGKSINGFKNGWVQSKVLQSIRSDNCSYTY